MEATAFIVLSTLGIAISCALVSAAVLIPVMASGFQNGPEAS